MWPQKLRVLMLTGRADTGGGPEHLLQLSRQLLDTCDIYIGAPQEPPYWDRYVALVGAARMFELPHRAFSLATLRELRAWCEQESIQVVHSHGRAAGAYSRMLPRAAGRLLVHTPHGSLQLKTPKDFGYWAADLAMARRTDRMIAVSASEARQLQRLLAPGSSLVVIPNGVRLPDQTVPAPEPGQVLRIVHVTRFVPQKNSHAVIETLARLRELGELDQFHVDVLGDGPGASEFIRRAREAQVDQNLTLHGAQPSILPFLLRSAFFLTTSRWEGLPLAVLEALAAGLPVIASQVAGNNDVVHSEVGRLFPVNDPTAAALQFVAIAADLDRWRDLSHAARRLVQERYSVQRMARETFELYRDARAPLVPRLREAA